VSHVQPSTVHLSSELTRSWRESVQVPLFVALVDMHNASEPKLHASASLTLHSPSPWGAPPGYRRADLPLYSLLGQPIGKVGVLVRLTCRGDSLLPHFERERAASLAAAPASARSSKRDAPAHAQKENQPPNPSPNPSRPAVVRVSRAYATRPVASARPPPRTQPPPLYFAHTHAEEEAEEEEASASDEPAAEEAEEAARGVWVPGEPAPSSAARYTRVPRPPCRVQISNRR
jgi:hypothetical protein